MHDKITRLMTERGLSARGLSAAAGLSPTTVWHILTNVSAARISSIDAIAKALGVDVSYLVSDYGDLTADEAELLRALRSMDAEQKALLRSMAAQLSSASRQTPKAPDGRQD